MSDTIVAVDPGDTLVTAADSRTITGRIMPWDEYGRTNTGTVVFPRGALHLPPDLSNLKLLAGHSPEGIPVGHATSVEDREDGLYATFTLGSHPEADTALLKASEKTIDAFSVEASIRERQGTTITDAVLNAVALVPIPAFRSARVSEVHAEHTPDTPAVDSPEEETEESTITEEKEEETVTKKTLAPGVLPGENSTPATEVHASLDQVIDYLGAAVRGDATSDMLAELTDITDAGMIQRSAPQWLGRLWEGVTYQRRIIPHLTQSPLRGRKAVGYRWKTKPGVDKYAGNKAEIPTKGASLETVERDAQRWAGGNDLDRIFWDFGETEFLRAYWEAMAESYAYETDREAGAFIVKNATTIEGTAPHIIRAIARGSIAIDQKLHSPATFALINPADFEQILTLTRLDAPEYLKLAGGIADPSKWVTSEFVEAGTAILGNKAAVTHFELAGSPLRVEAEHIAKGGRDAALFGYTALMLNRPEGLVKVSFKSTPLTSDSEA